MTDREPRRILHLIESWSHGGAESILISLASRLDQSRYRSLVCLLHKGWVHDQLQNKGVPTIILRQQHVERRLSLQEPQQKSVKFLQRIDFHFVTSLRKIIKEHKISLIHSHEFTMNCYGALVSLITGVPIITTVHGKNYYGDKLRRRLAYRFVGNISRMVVVSKSLKQFVVQKIGVSPKKVSVIYNGLDAAPFIDPSASEALKMTMNINAKAPIIGTVGNLYEVKGHIYFLRAAARVLKRYPFSLFLIIGRGPLLNKLQEEVSRLGITDSVKFLGFREDIFDLLSIFDVFVLPSLEEGFSIALVEAMLMGKPVVATRCGGPEEIMIDGLHGYLVQPRNEEALSEKVLDLLKSGTIATSLALAGQKWAQEKFSSEKMIRSYEALYAQVLGDA